MTQLRLLDYPVLRGRLLYFAVTIVIINIFDRFSGHGSTKELSGS